MRSVSSAELERLRKRGAITERKPKAAEKEKPKPVDPGVKHTATLAEIARTMKEVSAKQASGAATERAADAAERAEKAAVLIADIARSVTDLGIQQIAQIKQIVGTERLMPEPVPWEVKVTSRDHRGGIDTVSVIPKANRKR